MNNKYLLLLMLLLGLNIPIMAQEEQETEESEVEDFETAESETVEKKTFRFIYVAPDNTMTQQRLLAALNNHRNYIVSEGSPAIFYLASGDNPIIVKYNLDDESVEDSDNLFEKELLYYLKQSMSTNVEAGFDRQKIMELISQYDFIDEDGELSYKMTEFDFHVGKSFWDRGNNEAVIGSLFFALNAAKYMNEGQLQFNVFFRCPSSKGSFDRDKPFGQLNFDDINRRIIPQTED